MLSFPCALDVNLEGVELLCPECLHLVEPRLQGDEGLGYVAPGGIGQRSERCVKFIHHRIAVNHSDKQTIRWFPPFNDIIKFINHRVK